PFPPRLDLRAEPKNQLPNTTEARARTWAELAKTLMTRSGEGIAHAFPHSPKHETAIQPKSGLQLGANCRRRRRREVCGWRTRSVWGRIPISMGSASDSDMRSLGVELRGRGLGGL